MTTTPTEPRYRVLTVAASVLLDGARRVTLADVRALGWAPLDDLEVLALVDDVEDPGDLPLVVGTTAGGDLARARVALDLAAAVGTAHPLVALDDEPVRDDLTPDVVLDVRLSALALVDGWVRDSREDRAAVLPETGSEYARLALECALLASQFVQLASREGSVPVKALLQGARQWALDEHAKATGGQQ